MSMTCHNYHTILLPINPDLKDFKLIYLIQVKGSLRMLGMSCRQLQLTRLRSKCSTNPGLSAWMSVKLFYTTRSTGQISPNSLPLLTPVLLEVCQVLPLLKCAELCI